MTLPTSFLISILRVSYSLLPRKPKLYSLFLSNHDERIAERRKNFVSDKHRKTDIVLKMLTVHFALWRTPRTELLDARYAPITLPLLLVPLISTLILQGNPKEKFVNISQATQSSSIIYSY